MTRTFERSELPTSGYSYLVNPYRYAVNEAGFAYGRVKYSVEGYLLEVQTPVQTRHGKSHWRRIWQGAKDKPQSQLVKEIIYKARCV